MKRFTSILCASLLTLAMSSAALAGNITVTSGNITVTSGNITVFDEAETDLISVLIATLG